MKISTPAIFGLAYFFSELLTALGDRYRIYMQRAKRLTPFLY